MQKQTTDTPDIDLIALIINIWGQKFSIIISTLIITGLGVLYAFYATPIYRVSAQLTPPPAIELDELRISNPNKTSSFTYSPDASFLQQQKLLSLMEQTDIEDSDEETITTDEVFTLFLQTLSSSSHIKKAALQNKKLFETALNIPADDNLLTNIIKYRYIDLPNTAKKTNELAPDNYLISLEGPDREALQSLLLLDLNLASESTTQAVRKSFIRKLEKIIGEKKNNQNIKLEDLLNEISARKHYLINVRKDNIRELKAAYKIAETLNITSPTTSPKISSSNTKIEFSAMLSNTPPATYLKGTKLLSAEISSLEDLGDEIFIDRDLRSMEAQLTLIERSGRRTAQLQKERENLASQKNVMHFYNDTFEAPQKPIAPQKSIIIAVSFILGLMLGFFIAIIRLIIQGIKQT